jgi:hypothetical protein
MWKFIRTIYVQNCAGSTALFGVQEILNLAVDLKNIIAFSEQNFRRKDHKKNKIYLKLNDFLKEFIYLALLTF